MHPAAMDESCSLNVPGMLAEVSYFGNAFASYTQVLQSLGRPPIPQTCAHSDLLGRGHPDTRRPSTEGRSSVASGLQHVPGNQAIEGRGQSSSGVSAGTQAPHPAHLIDFETDSRREPEYRAATARRSAPPEARNLKRPSRWLIIAPTMSAIAEIDPEADECQARFRAGTVADLSPRVDIQVRDKLRAENAARRCGRPKSSPSRPPLFRKAIRSSMV